MRKPKVFSFAFLILLLTACIPGAATPVAPTLTPVPPTATVLPTETPAPTLTLTPTVTIWPTPNSDQIAAVLERLRMVYVRGLVNGGLYVQDGTNPPKQLTHGDQDREPSISDDGEKIVFYRGKSNEMNKIYSISADGTQEQPLITTSILTALNLGYTDTTELRALSFVPGTHQILFSTQEFPGGDRTYPGFRNNDLLLVDTDTAKIRRILDPGEVERFLVSPDGKLVVIQAPDQVKVVDLTGRITHSALLTYTFPSKYGFYPIGFDWAQDSSVLFVLPPREWNLDIYDNNAPRTIWKCPMKGGSPVEIQLTPPPLGGYYAISPDGNWIVYLYIHYSFFNEADLAIPEGIYFGNLQDGSTKLIAERPEDANYFQWASDSTHFSFAQYYPPTYREVFGNLNGELTIRKDVWDFISWVDASHYLFGNVEMGVVNIETTFKVAEFAGVSASYPGTFAFVLLQPATEK